MASDGQFMALQSVHKLLGNKYAFNDGLVTVIYQIPTLEEPVVLHLLLSGL